jgi:hypothetical protein
MPDSPEESHSIVGITVVIVVLAIVIIVGLTITAIVAGPPM